VCRSQKLHLVDRLRAIYELADLPLGSRIRYSFDQRHCAVISTGALFPLHHVTRHKGVRTSAWTAAARVKESIADQVKQFASAVGQTRFFDEYIVTTDGGHLLMQFRVNVRLSASRHIRCFRWRGGSTWFSEVLFTPHSD
jgi:hypothetical protein